MIRRQKPGQRTSPTVKPMATMNKKNLKNWELRLGLIQVVVLVGIVTGSMACVFYLGFFSGQKIGFDEAARKNLSSSVRLPIAENQVEEVSDELLSNMYARLEEDEAPLADESESDLPSPGVLEDLKEDLMNDPAVEAAVKRAEEQEAKRRVKDAATNPAEEESLEIERGPEIVVLGQDKKNDEPTLGKLLQDANKPREKEKSKPLREVITVIENEPPKIEPVEKTVEPKIEVKKPEAPAVKKTVPREPEPEPVKVSEPEKPAEPKIEPPRPPQPPAARTFSFVRDVVPRGWYAQVGAPKEISEADSLARKLRGSGFLVIIENAQVRGQVYFRILVGPESNRQQAERLLTQLKREPYIAGDPFIRLVK